MAEKTSLQCYWEQLSVVGEIWPNVFTGEWQWERECKVGHEAIVNWQQNVTCQLDLSSNPMQQASGMLWEPCLDWKEALKSMGPKVFFQNWGKDVCLLILCILFMNLVLDLSRWAFIVVVCSTTFHSHFVLMLWRACRYFRSFSQAKTIHWCLYEENECTAKIVFEIIIF